MIKIGFITGARSEYEFSKKLLKAIINETSLELEIIVTGMHLLKKFGNTIQEIEKDGFNISDRIPIFLEEPREKHIDFHLAIKNISESLIARRLDYVLIIGDRFESYAAALAAHLTNTKIIHAGGGNLTDGVDDNIYRYNITNLSKVHLATSINSYERLKSLPTLKTKDLYFTGSMSIDPIVDFKKNPIKISKLIPDLEGKKFGLMTFHPVPSEDLASLMDQSIAYILKHKIDVLVTYPNIDDGHEAIIEIIEKWQENKHVHVKKNLGAINYYAALNDCMFVIGNSSSGILEAPYFNKPVLDIGNRQIGRQKDISIVHVEAKVDKLLEQFDILNNNAWPEKECSEIYGSGNAVIEIIDILKQL